MELNSEIKEWFTSLGKEQYTLTIGAFNQFYEDNYVKKVDVIRKDKYSHSILIIKHLILFRSKLLVDGYVSAINSKNPIVAIISLRAYFETIGTLAYILKKYHQFYNNRITSEKFASEVEKLYLGIRDKELKNNIPIAPDPIGVMNLVDAVDEVIKIKFPNKSKNFRSAYERLSEFSHPNSLGYSLGQKVKGNGTEVYFYKFDEVYHKRHYFIEFFASATSIMFVLFNDLNVELSK